MTKLSTIVNTTIALGLAIAGIGAAAPAFASTEDGTVIEIKAQGYDLTSSSDVARLTDRGHRAARQVCMTDASGDLQAQMRQRLCLDKAVASVDAQIETLRRRAHDGMTSVVASAQITATRSPDTK